MNGRVVIGSPVFLFYRDFVSRIDQIVINTNLQ